MKQSALQRQLLGQATAKYAEQLSVAGDYLAKRGITEAVARSANLGVVVEPEPGHEQFIGRLAIPYVTKTGVVDIRFRSLNPAVEPKYMGMLGAETKMYNVLDIERASDYIGICEGELDTLTMSALIGIPCIGVPGAQSWKKHYTRLLADFSRVFVFADGDQAGREFAGSLARELPVTIIGCPDGDDVNSMYVKSGPEYFRSKVGLND